MKGLCPHVPEAAPGCYRNPTVMSFPAVLAVPVQDGSIWGPLPKSKDQSKELAERQS